MNCISIISLVVTLLALIVSIIMMSISIYQFSKTRKANFYNLVYDCLKPISVFIFDALNCKDSREEYPSAQLINDAELKLFSNIDALYSYGVGEKLPYLRQFATLNVSDSVDDYRLQNSMCYFHVLALIEDRYIKFRREIANKKVNKAYNNWFQSYIDTFRKMLYIQSDYSLTVFYKKRIKNKEKTLLTYYSKLREYYNYNYKLYLEHSIKVYNETHNDKWYDIYFKLKGGTFDGSD